MLGQALAYVALVARDPVVPAALLERQLGLARTNRDDGHGGKVATFAAGECVIALFPVGHPFVGADALPGVHHIAFGAADFNKSIALARDAGIAPTGHPMPGLSGRKRIALEPTSLCGIRTWLTEPLDAAAGRSSAVERIDHIGVASRDNHAAIALWRDQLGCLVESQQTDIEMMIPVESFTSDKHGVVYHTREPVPVGGLRVAFITVGDTELEFLQNFDPRHRAVVDHEAAGSTRQDQGAIAKFIAGRGAGLHHLAFKTPDINGLLSDLDRAGLPVIDRRGRPGSRGGLIGFVKPVGMGGILIHFDQRP